MALMPRFYDPQDARSDTAGVRDRLLAFFLRNECLNNMLIANILGDVPVLFVVTLEDAERRVHFVATQSAGRAVLVSTAEAAVMPEVPRAIDHVCRSFPGVVGPEPVASAVAKHLSASSKLLMPLGVYSCSAVTLPSPMPLGRQVVAGPEHANLLAQWVVAFGDEVGEPNTLDAARAYVASSRFHLWLNSDGVPVSSACSKGPTPHGIRISFVYTPLAHRKHGYAAANVALLTQSLLASGRSFVFLFTDMGNAISNALYKRIGFVFQGQSAHYQV